MPRILLIGGHGKISLLMTPRLLARSWHVTSLIRDPGQRGDIFAAAGNQEGTTSNLDVLVESLEEVKSKGDAERILNKVNPDWVVWSAGAGGKGGPSRTHAIDQLACQHFTRAILAQPQRITKFLVVSAINARRHRAPWWSGPEWAHVEELNATVLKTYTAAKIAADEFLTVGAEEAKGGGVDGGFQYLILRPGALSDGKAEGRVRLGKMSPVGTVSREDVAEVAVRLLADGRARVWIDLMGGGEREIGEEVERVLSEGVNSMDGESLEDMKKAVEQDQKSS